MEAKITTAGIGSVMVDAGAGTLQPTTWVVGQRLGVGFGFDDARKAEIARERRCSIVRQANEKCCQPEFGWRWIDHNGCDAGMAC